MNRYQVFAARIFSLVLVGLIAGNAWGWQVTEQSPQVRNPALREELLNRMNADKLARHALVESAQTSVNGLPDPQLIQKRNDVDTSNREWMEAFLNRFDYWPGKSDVGEDGAHAAWLIVHHADNDVQFQQSCLRRMQDLRVKSPGEVDPGDVAYLTDRVRVGLGMKQRYGTQVMMREGQFRPLQVENPEELDALRAKMGLQSMDDYLRSLRFNYARTRGNTTNR